jgi:hypothetical protein
VSASAIPLNTHIQPRAKKTNASAEAPSVSTAKNVKNGARKKWSHGVWCSK